MQTNASEVEVANLAAHITLDSSNLKIIVFSIDVSMGEAYTLELELVGTASNGQAFARPFTVTYET